MLKEITNTQEFDQEVASGTVIVDFYSQTCAPCKALAMHLGMLNDELGDKVKILKVDAGEQFELVDRYQVGSVPTVFKFVDGQPEDMFIGARPKDFFLTWI